VPAGQTAQQVPLLKQVCPLGQLVALQTQVPPLQTGVVPLHVVPQLPQWVASLATQAPPQQSLPAPQLVLSHRQRVPSQRCPAAQLSAVHAHVPA
jgi:hypothetical protein